MTRLRRMMLEALQRRNYSAETIRQYLWSVAQFSKDFGKRPDQLGPDELRTYQAYLLRERKLAVGSVVANVAALRFFYVRVLQRHELREDLPYPKDHRRLPTVLSLGEVMRLINAAGNLLQRALLMTLYGTGMRRTEVSLLKVRDIDSRRMMLLVEVPLDRGAKQSHYQTTRSPQGGRAIIVAMDGRVADIEGGGFVLFDRFLISEVQKDCCNKPIAWDMARWKKTYDLRGDPQIDIRYEYGEPSYS